MCPGIPADCTTFAGLSNLISSQAEIDVISNFRTAFSNFRDAFRAAIEVDIHEIDNSINNDTSFADLSAAFANAC